MQSGVVSQERMGGGICYGKRGLESGAKLWSLGLILREDLMHKNDIAL